ncbi:unnamed protein product [Acanthoscelides obtectus]|uniref:BED-type domain-containing protein n=1 Tax=Acanthoscelides obtectus TaxID=200917 RepID=A0A9P0K3E8_ACAOB|nr:unnamed protein product [Acanthoscelides obtectus]CAK1660375.1 Zinc finger BED domain-containing protein 5 [Acanthoscelides obtectus]
MAEKAPAQAETKFKEKDELQLPQCVICMKVLSNDTMRPNRLKRHLKQQHPTLVLETKEFFSSKAESPKRMRLDKSGSYHTGARSEDIFNSISNFVEKNDLDWKKLIGLCTDGAPAMIGVRSGLTRNLKEKNPAMVSTHCVIHWQALASKTLPLKLRHTLDSAIRIVNYIKSSALNSRELARFPELHQYVSARDSMISNIEAQSSTP